MLIQLVKTLGETAPVALIRKYVAAGTLLLVLTIKGQSETIYSTSTVDVTSPGTTTVEYTAVTPPH